MQLFNFIGDVCISYKNVNFRKEIYMGKNGGNSRILKIWAITFVVTMIIMCLLPTPNDNDSVMTYDEVIVAIKEGDIKKIVAQENSLHIQITMKDDAEKTATIPSLEELSTVLLSEMENGNQIEFEIGAASIFSSIFSSLLSLALTIALFSFMMKRMTGDSNYSVKPVTSKVKFSDVAGIDEEKAQLEEVVKFLKNPEMYAQMGARIPKGILLNGDPGTGKTLLAKAIAGEAGVPFFQATGSSFEEKFVGVGADRVRKLFAEAKKAAPSIIFIDEIDSVAQNRYSGKSYSEQTLNQLLAEMDGFSTEENVIVIAATNHIDILDPAITRPGRFDRHVFIPKPDVVAREKILRLHARNKRLASDVSIKDIAKRTVGFAGADLENLLNEAAIYSVNNGKIYISSSDIDEAIARVLVGLKKGEPAISDEEKWLTAVHEAGHAILSAVVRPKIKNFGISIVPRGNAGGYNVFDESDTVYNKKSDLLLQMQVLYGGRIAEELILGDISSGASNDLERASKIAHMMITRFSMNGSLLTKITAEANFNQQLDTKSIEEAEKICRENYEEAKRVAETYKDKINKLAKLLYEREYLSQQDVETFIANNL